MRKIPMTNYVIAAIIMILSIFLVYILAIEYTVRKEYLEKAEISFMSEVKPDELDNYIVENHDVLIYTNDSKSSNKKIDREVKKILTNNDYIKDTVYLNVSNLSDEYYNNFLIKYNIDLKKIGSNSFIIIKNGKVIKKININENNIKKLKGYIDTFYGV